MDDYGRYPHRNRRRYDDDEQLTGRRYHADSYRRRRRSQKRHSHSRSSSSRSDEDQKGVIEFKKDEIVHVAGQGTFGTVLECLDHKHAMKQVAVKAVRSVERYLDAASIEIEILQKICEKDYANASLCVRLLSWFSARHHRREHMFLVFEYLGRDLYTFMKRNRHNGFSIEHVRSFAHQLLQAVSFCHSLKLCHTDLKPENILLCSSEYVTCPETGNRSPVSTAIRLIDFGGATFEHERHSRTVATRQYRAPEVIFGLPWSYPSDIWSLGCIFAELISGALLFNTHEDIEHLALMQKVLGEEFPKEMVNRALEPFRFGTESVGRAANPKKTRRGRSSDPVAIDLLSTSRLRIRWPENASSSDSIKHVASYSVLNEIVPHPLLTDLIRKMLRFEPSERLTAREALQHPFFTSIQ